MKKGHMARLHREMQSLRRQHLEPRRAQFRDDLSSSAIPSLFAKFLTTAEEIPYEVYIKFANTEPRMDQVTAKKIFAKTKSDVNAILGGKGGEENFDLILDCEWRSSEPTQDGAKFTFHSFLHAEEGPDMKCPEGYVIVSGFHFWTCIEHGKGLNRAHKNRQGIEFVAGVGKVEQDDGTPIKDALVALRFRSPKVGQVHLQLKGYLIAEPEHLLGMDQYRMSVAFKDGAIKSGASLGWDGDWSQNVIEGKALRWRS
mmetsp:Transcript_27216/g.50828  ORF Transcript_27216/g.50828 Transcript_27216/m.50828 type:complete len:256 (-) Transcript_27216:258-1025(-)